MKFLGVNVNSQKRLAGAWQTKEIYLVLKLAGKAAKLLLITFAHHFTCYLCLDKKTIIKRNN
jgi:hypothetical protein